jgi:hypothetical protein
LYVNVVDPILDMWTTFVLLIIIFSIGCRKRDGLWSTNHEAAFQQEVKVPSPLQPQQTWPAQSHPQQQQQQGFAQYYVPQQQQQQGINQYYTPVYNYPEASQGQPAMQSGYAPQPPLPSQSPIGQTNSHY